MRMMMEAASTSETSVDNYFTRQYIPEDNSEVHTRRRENLKSHILIFFFNLCLNLLCGIFPSGFQTKILYTFLISHILATRLAHLISLDMTIHTIIGEEHKNYGTPSFLGYNAM
jgi:hypothetical protein